MLNAYYKIAEMFSFRCLIVLTFIFRSLIHFELYFVYGVRYSWIFMFIQYAFYLF